MRCCTLVSIETERSSDDECLLALLLRLSTIRHRGAAPSNGGLESTQNCIGEYSIVISLASVA